MKLICHTDNPAECYPKIFQATDEFQIVREDQDLPKGLHVRLNIQTGLKEAKINVPDEVNPALEGLPVDSSVVVVEQPEEGSPPPSPPKIPANAPGYDPDGKIKEPKNPQGGADEGGAFYRSLSILKKGLNIDDALEMLEDISHDIYYGLKIAEDYDTIRQLFCLAKPTTAAAEEESNNNNNNNRARLAALTISSTVQNNPKALSEIEKHSAALQKDKCPGSKEPLGTTTAPLIFRLVPQLAESETGNPNPALAKVRISAVSGLLKSPAIRTQFLANGGMELLLNLLATTTISDQGWEPVQEKIAFLILDNFLDEEMGAALGEWPVDKQAKDADCAARAGAGTGTENEGIRGDCWDWHAQKIAERFRSSGKGKNHWSAELLKKLKEQRKANGNGKGNAAKRKSGKKDEL